MAVVFKKRLRQLFSSPELRPTPLFELDYYFMLRPKPLFSSHRGEGEQHDAGQQNR